MTDELENKFKESLGELPSSPQVRVSGVGTYELQMLVKVSANLGLAVIRLDKTSARLAKANIVLGIDLALIGVIQVVLVVRGH